jgi:hypothetical protein
VRAMLLEDFGYRKLKAEGTRPLLVLVVAGPEDPRFTLPDGSHLLHDESFYDDLIFNLVHRGIFVRLVEDSVVGYYRAVSNGRFGWARALPQVAPIRISQEEAALGLPERLGLIQRWVSTSRRSMLLVIQRSPRTN